MPNLGTCDPASNLQIRALWGKMAPMLSWEHGVVEHVERRAVQVGSLSLTVVQYPVKIENILFVAI